MPKDSPRKKQLPRSLTRSLTRSLSKVSIAPEAAIALANANDLGEVVIEVVLATGLKKPTRVGTPAPSPFVKLAVRGKEQLSRKQERTLYPMWNERLVWKGKRGELCTPKMLVELLAWDPLTPASMGSAEVDLSRLLVGDSCDLMVALGETQGQLQLRGLWVAREKGKVHLHLDSASGLPSPSGKSGAANPFVVALLNGRDHRSAVKKNSRSPQWSERFEWAGFKSELTNRSLRLEVRNKDAVYMRKHGKAEVLGTVDVDLRALFEGTSGENVHELELTLSSKGGDSGQLHVKLRWEEGCEDWEADAVASREASSRVATKMKLSDRLKCLIPGRKKIDKYGSAVDQHVKTINSFQERHSKVEARQSKAEETMDEADDLMEELREQQEDIVRQVILAEHKPAWDDALRVVVDVAFDSMSSLSEVAEAIMEQLLEGASLASEDHVAALLLVHPERHGSDALLQLVLLTTYYLPLTTYHLPPTTYHLLLTTYYSLPTTYYLGHIFVAECTEAAASYSARLTANAQWSPSSRNPLSVAAYNVLNSGEPLLSFCPDGGDDSWRMCPLQEKGGRTFGVLLSGGTIFKGEWLLEMAKLGGQMLEKVWRREQLETLIKVAQASHLCYLVITPTRGPHQGRTGELAPAQALQSAPT